MINIHRFLVSGYLYNKTLYTFSFADRIQIDLGILEFMPSSCDEELNSLADEELVSKINELNKPWWEDTYRKELHNQAERLNAIYPHLHDKELEDALKSHDSGRLVEFIEGVTNRKFNIELQFQLQA